MPLVTLSGTISAADLNNNFSVASGLAYAARKRYQQQDLLVLGLTSTTSVGLRTFDFTPEDDIEIATLMLEGSNPDATTRVLTASFTVVDAAGADASEIYMLGVTPTITLSMTAAASYSRSRTTFTSAAPNLRLPAGLTVRITITSDTASACTKAQASLVYRTEARRR